MFAVFNRLSPSPWFRKPEADLREVEVCKDDGYLPAGGCETELQLAPAASRFESLSPYHRLAHLDAKSKQRVNAQCEAPDSALSAMSRRSVDVVAAETV